MSLKEKLEEYLKEKSLIEIATKSERQVTGVIKVLGDDFLTISHSLERSITVKEPNGEKTKKIEVLNLETSLLFCDIDSISKIVSKVVK